MRLWAVSPNSRDTLTCSVSISYSFDKDLSIPSANREEKKQAVLQLSEATISHQTRLFHSKIVSKDFVASVSRSPNETAAIENGDE